MSHTPAMVIAVDLPIRRSDIEPAVSMARSARWQIHLVHAAPPEPDFVGYAETGGLAEAEYRDQQLQRWREQLDDLADELSADGPADARIVTGPIVEVILSVADEVDAQLIAIVGHRHNVAHRLLLGSVAASLLRASQRPVLVVPPGGGESEHVGARAAVDRLIEVIDRDETEGASSSELEQVRDAAQEFLESDTDSDADVDVEARSGNRLLDALHRFETDHPSLTRAVNDVAYYLSGMGL